jgi:hypothetical protein
MKPQKAQKKIGPQKAQNPFSSVKTADSTFCVFVLFCG